MAQVRAKQLDPYRATETPVLIVIVCVVRIHVHVVTITITIERIAVGKLLMKTVRNAL